MDTNGYVDMDDGLKRVRGNKGLYVRMLKLFLASEDFDKLEAALSADDLKLASESAHAIKGITGNLSLTKLYETSTELMSSLRTGARDEELIEKYRGDLVKTKEYVNGIISENS